VNEDVNSSYQSSLVESTVAYKRQTTLRATQSHVINMLIQQNSYSPQAPKHNKKKASLTSPFSNNFIKCFADLLPTRDVIITLRSLSKQFNRAMKTYLPTRLQQQAWFINAFLEQNQGYND
jgi:hypothetical protein